MFSLGCLLCSLRWVPFSRGRCKPFVGRADCKPVGWAPPFQTLVSTRQSLHRLFAPSALLSDLPLLPGAKSTRSGTPSTRPPSGHVLRGPPLQVCLLVPGVHVLSWGCHTRVTTGRVSGQREGPFKGPPTPRTCHPQDVPPAPLGCSPRLPPPLRGLRATCGPSAHAHHASPRTAPSRWGPARFPWQPHWPEGALCLQVPEQRRPPWTQTPRRACRWACAWCGAWTGSGASRTAARAA